MRIYIRKREAMRTYVQTYAYVRTGLRVLTCEMMHFPKDKDVFLKDQELFKKDNELFKKDLSLFTSARTLCTVTFHEGAHVHFLRKNA